MIEPAKCEESHVEAGQLFPEPVGKVLRFRSLAADKVDATRTDAVGYETIVVGDNIGFR